MPNQSSVFLPQLLVLPLQAANLPLQVLDHLPLLPPQLVRLAERLLQEGHLRVQVRNVLLPLLGGVLGGGGERGHLEEGELRVGVGGLSQGKSGGGGSRLGGGGGGLVRLLLLLWL